MLLFTVSLSTSLKVLYDPSTLFDFVGPLVPLLLPLLLFRVVRILFLLVFLFPIASYLSHFNNIIDFSILIA